jgi:hypothetical protein
LSKEITNQIDDDKPTKNEIIKQPNGQELGSGLLAKEMGTTGDSYTQTEDDSIKFITTDAIIG